MPDTPDEKVLEPPGIHLADFPHYAGTHCSSSSIADVLRFDGFDATEPMVFGLGGGLGFIHARDPAGSPFHRFNGRAPDLEGKFYRRFGHPLAWAGRWDPQAIAQCLAAGRPLLAQTDIAALPYYEPVHFPLHGIVVTGWDGAHATVADTFSQVLQRIPAQALHDALLGEGCPFMASPVHPGPVFRIAPAPRIAYTVTPALLESAIEQAASELLTEGIPAMREVALAIPRWPAEGDWAWAARFAYQGIEKRGTGGGGFRGLYADFLAEAEPFLPWLRGLDAVERMLALAGDWSAIAGRFKRAFVEQDPGHLEGAGRDLDRVAGTEAVLFAQLAAAAAGAPRFGR